jgi:hypothetical protein
VVSDFTGKDLLVHPDQATDANRLGRPVRLAGRDHMIAAATSTEWVTAWKQQDQGSTLADDPAFAAIAQRLDDAGVVSAYLAHAPFSARALLGAKATPTRVEKYGDTLLPESFDTVRLGWAAPGGAAQMVAVYHFANATTAQDAAAPLEKIWRHGNSAARHMPLSQLVTVQSVTAQDETVTVRLTPGPKGQPDALMDLLRLRDQPFGHR